MSIVCGGDGAHGFDHVLSQSNVCVGIRELVGAVGSVVVYVEMSALLAALMFFQ